MKWIYSLIIFAGLMGSLAWGNDSPEEAAPEELEGEEIPVTPPSPPPADSAPKPAGLPKNLYGSLALKAEYHNMLKGDVTEDHQYNLRQLQLGWNSESGFWPFRFELGYSTWHPFWGVSQAWLGFRPGRYFSLKAGLFPKPFLSSMYKKLEQSPLPERGYLLWPFLGRGQGYAGRDVGISLKTAAPGTKASLEIGWFAGLPRADGFDDPREDWETRVPLRDLVANLRGQVGEVLTLELSGSLKTFGNPGGSWRGRSYHSAVLGEIEVNLARAEFYARASGGEDQAGRAPGVSGPRKMFFAYEMGGSYLFWQRGLSGVAGVAQAEGLDPYVTAALAGVNDGQQTYLLGLKGFHKNHWARMGVYQRRLINAMLAQQYRVGYHFELLLGSSF